MNNRTLRRSANLVLTAAGIAAIFSAILLGDTLAMQFQMLFALAGVLLMEVGVWGMSNRVMPEQRRFSGLREEGDHILSLIRKLNAVAVAKELGIDNNNRFEETLEEMHLSIVRMADLAAKEDPDNSSGYGGEALRRVAESLIKKPA